MVHTERIFVLYVIELRVYMVFVCVCMHICIGININIYTHWFTYVFINKGTFVKVLRMIKTRKSLENTIAQLSIQIHIYDFMYSYIGIQYIGSTVIHALVK